MKQIYILISLVLVQLIEGADPQTDVSLIFIYKVNFESELNYVFYISFVIFRFSWRRVHSQNIETDVELSR